jgi:hypothetical protein
MKAVDIGVYITTEDGNRHPMPALKLPPDIEAMVDQMFNLMVDSAGLDLAARLDILKHSSTFLISVVLQYSLSELAKELVAQGVDFSFTGLNS